jgi:hypothetical protein
MIEIFFYLLSNQMKMLYCHCVYCLNILWISLIPKCVLDL